MRIIIGVVLAVLMSGCAPTVKGNATGGLIDSGISSYARTFDAAEAHCKKFDKVAKVSRVSAWSGVMYFDCVAP